MNKLVYNYMVSVPGAIFGTLCQPTQLSVSPDSFVDHDIHIGSAENHSIVVRVDPSVPMYATTPRLSTEPRSARGGM